MQIRAALNTVLFLVATSVYATLAFVSCFVAPGGAALLALARAWGCTLRFLCGIRVTVTGAERIARGTAVIYMPNHLSNIDVPCLMSVIPRIRFVTKHTIRYIPVFGWALWLARFPFVNRGQRESAIASLRVAARQISERGHTIVVFPEGTRSRDGRLGEFKKGPFALAMEANVPVVPVVIRGTREIVRKGSALIYPGAVSIAIGDALAPASFATKEDLMARVRAALDLGARA